jgi:hypothetical protein
MNTEQSELLAQVAALRRAASLMRATQARMGHLDSMTDGQRISLESDLRKAGAVLDAATTALADLRAQLNYTCNHAPDRSVS